MTTFVALLRAVNLGGKGMVAMAELRALAAQLGLAQIRTVAQTGNLLVEAKAADAEVLENRLEDAIQRRFDYEVPIVIRTAPQWKKVAAGNPFAREAEDDPSHLLVFSLKKKPTPGSVAELRQAIQGREYLELKDRTLYIVYPEGIGQSKLTAAMIERRLGVRGTGRNWNTVQKILNAL